MRKIFKLITMTVLAVCATPAMVSCSGNNSPSEPDYYDPEHRPFGKYDEMITIKGVMEYLAHNDSRVPSSVTPDNQKFIQFLREDLNINFEYMWKVPPQQYENKLSGSILSKKYPDILKVNASQYKNFKEKGLLKDLTETYKYASPTVQKFLNRDPSIIESLKEKDGKIYGIPQYDDQLKDVPVMFYRKDWLQELKLDVPKTPDELFNVLMQFKNKKGANIGIAVAKDLVASYFSLDRYLQMFGYQPYCWIEGEDGKLMSSDISDEAREGITFIKKLYDNGLMAKDFAATDAATAESQLKTSKAGIVFGPWWTYEYPVGDLLNDQDWGSAPIPHKEGTTITLQRQNVSHYYVVLKQCKNPEALMKMINMYIELDGKEGAKPEDGYVWSWCPTQFNDPTDIDETYIKLNKQLETDPTASQPAPAEWTSHEKKLWDAYPRYLEWKKDHGAVKFESNNFANIIGRINTDGAWAAIRETNSENRFKYNEYYDLPTENQSKYGGQISTHTEVYFAEAIAGRVNIADDNSWNAYVAEWKKLGGDAITNDVNAWYSAKKAKAGA